MDNEEFYLGKKGALYLLRQNGSLSRFGIRVHADGTVEVFDQLTKRWHTLPEVIPDRSGDPIRIRVERVAQ